MKVSRRTQWRHLYRRLSEILSTQGIESDEGKGDYWIVDDDWGGFNQKVCIFKIEFLTKKIASDVQILLAREFPMWSVMFQLDITHPAEDVPPEGIVVFHDKIQEDWNVSNLKKLFGVNADWFP